MVCMVTMCWFIFAGVPGYIFLDIDAIVVSLDLRI